MTLENTPAAYLRTEEEHDARVMEPDGSISLRDGGISDATTTTTTTTTKPSSSSSPADVLSCILCMECIGDWNALRHHLLKNHEVKREALHAFMSLVDQPKLTFSSPADDETNSRVTDLGNNDELTKKSRETASNVSADYFCGGSSKRSVDRNDESAAECGVCSAAFPDFAFLFKHQDEAGHLDVRMTSAGPCYVCWRAECGQTFSTVTTLRCHFVNTHAAVKSDGDAPTTTTTAAAATSELTDGTDRFQCHQCDQVLRKKEEFRMHCYCHKMEKAMECCSCGTRFSSVHEFRKHKQVVHNEELTSEQQELYEASHAAASSLALLGASGLEYVTNHSSKTSNLTTTVRKKDAQSGEADSMTETAVENSAAEDKMDPRLDENSNQSKFVGTKGIVGLAEDGDVLNCSHNGVLHNKCFSCKTGFDGTNNLTDCQQKHKRKRSHPSKVISDLPKQNLISSVSTMGKSESSYSRDKSMLDLRASIGNKNRSIEAATLTSQLPVLVNTTLSSSSSSAVSQSGRSAHPLQPTDRPFRCSLCKVSYTQKMQLDSHLSSQQHLSRCAKISDPLIRQRTSTTSMQMMLPFAGNQADQVSQFAELMRQQKVLIPSFLPFGVPMVNPLMMPLLTNCVAPSLGGPCGEADPMSASSLTTTKQISTAGKPSKHQELEPKMEPVSDLKNPTSKLLLCDDVAEKTEYSCPRCCETFSSVEQLDRHKEEIECLEAARNILGPDPNSSGCNQTMMESILQRIGYECVKQFNEYRQKPKQSNRHISSSELEKGSLEDSKSSCEAQEAAKNVKESETERYENNKYFCWMCSKSFSTIFVLKAHQEQVHNQIIPIDAIEKLHNELKVNYEKICKQEFSERSDTGGQKRQHEIFQAVRQASAEEEIKLKQQQQQQQQIQIAAAIQNMQMNLMLSSGILPQIFQRLPGSGQHITSIPPEFFAPQPFPMIDPMLMVQLQQRQSTSSMTLPIASPTQLSSAAAGNQKSARTRISEQQLQVLRANFDINNSPTEEQIQEMSEKTGLVMKVIKHWFRNTLFKERQRNKDSPYNFNVPPVTTLSLSDCERLPRTSSAKEISSSSDENSVNASNSDLQSEPRLGSAVTNLVAKSEMADDSVLKVDKASFSQMPSRSEDPIALLSQGTSEFKLVDPQHGINLNAVMMNNLYNLPHGAERRAGRTRFSNHQNQVLQEFFDRNPYPKDDEVEALSRALNLRVRVIVVWFQNARQRIRKTEGHTLLAEGGTKQAQFQSGACGFSPDQQIELLQHQLTEHSVSKGSGPRGPSSSNQVSIEDEEEQGSGGSSLGNEPDYDNTGRRSTEEVKLECNWAFEFADRLNEHQRDMQSSQNPSSLSPSAGGMRQQLHFSQKLLPELNQKMMEDGAFLQQASDNEEHRADRRMRTTLAQDQLEYLYQKFAAESNPSRSALEAIAAHLNLKPRVVQVWFQNTRARERRGQHRVNSQKSLVRCPQCSSMFRGKTALEAHQAEQHPQSISNIGGYAVDLVRNMQGMSSGMESVVPPFLAPSPMMTAAGISTLQSNMHYLYEKSFQEYMSKLTNLHAPTQQMAPSSSSSSSSNQSIQSAPITKPSKQTSTKSEDGPLDLTTSSVTTRNDRNGQSLPEVVDGPHSSLFTQNLDDSFSETYSENDENGGFRGVDNTSPSALGANPSCSGTMFGAGKRYRTQMSSLQIRVLRAIFSSYKTPSLAECEILGQQIGLGKRVVQVWFQNSRAKEKKASFPGFEKSDGTGAGGNAFFPQLGSSPSSCCLCHVTYSINHTMQDHLFTKMHIDRVKVVVNSSEFGKSFPNIAFGESGDSFDQHTQFSSKNPLPMIKSMTNSPTVISTRTLELAADVHSSSNNHSVSFERNSKRQYVMPKKVSRSQSKGQPGDSEKNVQNSAPILSPSMAFVNPLDASLRQFVGVPPAPNDLLGAMMPYLYPGGAIPPVLPGFNPMQLLSQAPNILPNMAYALLNSAAVCGIQLVQLQIPKRAIEQIQDRLKDKMCVLATYSDDCLTSAEVKTHLDSAEVAWLVEKAIHVGYICKRCHVVFPQVDACNAHQAALCFKGAEHFGDSVLKLEQRLYQCSCCKAHCVTVKEFKVHCAQDDHRKAASLGAGSFASRTNSTASSSPGASQRLAEDVVPKEVQPPSVADVKLEKEDG